MAQIVDDSTKNIYGAYTTFYTSERFIKNNLPEPYTNPDTSVYLFEKYSRVDASNRQFQDLGFLGAPILNQRYDLPVESGRTFGFTGYNHYFKTVDDIKYFDTKSPFMSVGVIFGGQNRSKIDFGFSRNVNENWNLGININRIAADKQIARVAEGDRAAESSAFDLYTHYKHPKVPYELAFSIARLKHEVADIGGVLIEDGAPRADFFLYQDAVTQLENANSRDQRSRLHFYQQYKIGSGFQIYHQFDRTTQEYKYFDSAEDDRYDDFYPSFILDEDTTNEMSTFSSTVNEGGLKGEIKGAFYRFYVKYRSLIYDTKYLIEESVGETFAGAYLRFNWRDKFAVIGNGELSNEGFYKLEGELSSDVLALSYISSRSAPSFQSQQYSGNYHLWSNSFDPVFSNSIKGELNLKWNIFTIQPRASITTISNFVYMNETQISTQATEGIVISRVGGKLSMEFLRGSSLFGMNENEAFIFESDLVISTVTGGAADAIRLPTARYSGRFFWRGTWWSDAVPIEIGADLYSWTSYFANAYDPVTSQFYLQNDLRLEQYVAIDVFVNMKVSNLTTFVKWTHVNQPTGDGYMSSPYFPAQKSITELGIRWLFFD